MSTNSLIHPHAKPLAIAIIAAFSLGFGGLTWATGTPAPYAGARAPEATHPSGTLEHALVGSTQQPDKPTATANKNPAQKTQKKKTTTLSTIEVTAHARVQNINAIPASIGVIGSIQMHALNVDRISDLDGYFSNVRIRNGSSPLSANVTMRGIGGHSFLIGFTNRIGVYLDGVYIGESPAMNQSVLGISRVEVLRGPQGTFFGRNTSAGAINIITQRPGPVPQGRVSVRAGNYGLFREDFKVSGPLANGIYGGLYLGNVNRHGWIRNIPNNVTGPTRKRKSMRAQLDIRRYQNWDIYLTLDGMRARQRSAGGHPISNLLGNAPITGFTDDPFTTNLNLTSPSLQTIYGAAATVAYTLPNQSILKSITSDRTTLFSIPIDVDDSPLDILSVAYDFRYKQFTQEFQLVSNENDNFSYVFGAFYYRLDARQGRYAFGGPVAPALGLGTGTIESTFGTVRTTNVAFYGNAKYQFSPGWFLDLGARWTDAQKAAYYTIDSTRVPQLGLATGVFQKVISTTNLSPTISITRKIGEHSNVYARFSQGFDEGGFDLDFVSAQQFPDHMTTKPEFVNDYEFGFKGSVFNGRANYHLALFDTYYRDFQGNGHVHTSGGVVLSAPTNLGKVHTRGAELEGAVRVTNNLTMRASLGTVHVESSDKASATANGLPTPTHAVSGTPKYSASIGAVYTSSFGGGYNGKLSFRYSYRAADYSEGAGVKTMSLGGHSVHWGFIPAHGLMDGSYTLYFPDDRWELQVWGRNIFNKHYLRSFHHDFFGTYTETVAQPRTYGINVTLNF